MIRTDNICFLTGILCFILAAALPLWIGCSKSDNKPAEPENTAAPETNDTPSVIEADIEETGNAEVNVDENTLPAEGANADVELPGADGKVKVVEPGTPFDKVTSSAKVVVVDFNATWCGPCRSLGPYLERMAESYNSDGVSFFSVDVDQHRKLAEELDIPSIPDVRIYLDGNQVDKVVGNNPLEVMNKIETVIQTEK